MKKLCPLIRRVAFFRKGVHSTVALLAKKSQKQLDKTVNLTKQLTENNLDNQLNGQGVSKGHYPEIEAMFFLCENQGAHKIN